MLRYERLALVCFSIIQEDALVNTDTQGVSTTEARAIEHPRKKLTTSPSAMGRELARNRDDEVPTEIIDASISQRIALLMSYRSEVYVFHNVSDDIRFGEECDVWYAGDPKQANSLVALIQSVGVPVLIGNVRVTDLRGRTGEGIVVPRNAFVKQEGE